MSVIAAFDSASRSYDGAAQMQSEIAARLLEGIAGSPRRILDIGCGTGLLTAMAQKRWPHAEITGIDAAATMLERARAKLPSARFVQADAADLRLGERFDLIISSMVLHWLADSAAVLAGWQSLLAPGASLHVAVPVAGSLSEWKDLCAREGVTDRLWPFPARALFAAQGETQRHNAIYGSARDFLKSLHYTGANSSAPKTSPMPPACLRRILRQAPQPFTVNFQIAYLRLQPSHIRD